MEATITNLIKTIAHHDHRYYVLNDPEISDTQYNAIFAKLQRLESEHPELMDPNSPTQRIGSDIANNFTGYAHSEPMLSVQSYYSEGALLTEMVDLSHLAFSVESKLDGIAIELEYRNGNLFRALTRGDGTKGQDVTANIRTIKSIPLVVNANCILPLIIRGEIIITAPDLKALNQARKTQKLNPLPTQRNAAATLVMSKTTAEACAGKLSAYFYYTNQNTTQAETFDYLQSNGFAIPAHISDVSYSNLLVAINSLLPSASCLLPVDGIVIKVESPDERKTIGDTSRHHKWAFALKTQSESFDTAFLFIEYSFSPDGTITPIIHFAPVIHEGTAYTKVKSSFAQLHRLSVAIGHKVSIKINGSVSAEIIGVSGTPFYKIPVPDKCPCCKFPIDNSAKMIKCINPDCPEKTDSKFNLEEAVNVFQNLGTQYGSLAEIRYAASNTMAVVCRKAKSSHMPVIIFTASGQIDRIMYNAGLIFKSKKH